MAGHTFVVAKEVFIMVTVIFKSPQFGLTLCFQFVSAAASAAAAAAAMTFKP